MSTKSSITVHSRHIHIGSRRGSHWHHETPFLPLSFMWNEENGLGAPSLKHTAMKELLSDQSIWKPELFLDVPWHIAQHIWERLGRAQHQTSWAWKIMATMYPQEFRQSSHYFRLSVVDVMEPMQTYLEQMNDDACNWRAILSISSSNTSTTDLVWIGNMKNLVALDISAMTSRLRNDDPFDCKRFGLGDRIVRSWLEIAQSSGSLQQLRVLRLYHQHELTPQALWMLEKLPQLQIVVVYQCQPFIERFQGELEEQDEVRCGGWIARRVDRLLEDPETKTETLRRLGPLLELYESTLGAEKGCSVDPGVEEKPPMLDPDVPILEYQLPFGIARECASNKLEIRAKYYGASVVILTRAPWKGEKRAPAPAQSISGGNGKRVMKDRGVRDMGDLLGQFL